MVNQRAFTLIELMIVIVIVAILASLAYPSYQSYVIKTKRVESQAELLHIASRVQQYQIANRTLKKDNGEYKSLFDLGLPEKLPLQGESLYTVELIFKNNIWELIAKPENGKRQQADGVFKVDQNGYKCWLKAATDCTASPITNWDGR